MPAPLPPPPPAPARPGLLGAAACLCLLLAGPVSWLHLPLEGKVSGLRLSLAQPWFDTGLSPLTPWSFGGGCLLAGVMLALLCLTPWRRRASLWLTAAAGVAFLLMLFMARLALRLDDLAYLLDQRQQLHLAVIFARRFLKVAYVLADAPPLDVLPLDLAAAPARVWDSLVFLSWGLLWVLLAAGLMLAVSWRLAPPARRPWGAIAAIAALGVALLLCFAPLVQRDRTLEQAANTLVAGQAHEARDLLEAAATRHPDLWAWAPFLYLLGQAHQRLGLDTPAQQFYEGATYFLISRTPTPASQANLARLRRHLTLAAAAPEPHLSRRARHLLAWSLILAGFSRYEALDAPAALFLWEEARRLSPRLLPASLFLAKARLDLRVGQDAYDDALRFINSAQFRFLRSLAWSLAGDARYQANRFMEARQCYEISLKIYHYMNFRAYFGLAGN